MQTNITLRELSDKVVSLSWRRIAKYAAILYIGQALVGASVGIYVGVMYPEEVISYIGSMK